MIIIIIKTVRKIWGGEGSQREVAAEPIDNYAFLLGKSDHDYELGKRQSYYQSLLPERSELIPPSSLGGGDSGD